MNRKENALVPVPISKKLEIIKDSLIDLEAIRLRLSKTILEFGFADETFTSPLRELMLRATLFQTDHFIKNADGSKVAHFKEIHASFMAMHFYVANFVKNVRDEDYHIEFPSSDQFFSYRTIEGYSDYEAELAFKYFYEILGIKDGTPKTTKQWEDFRIFIDPNTRGKALELMKDLEEYFAFIFEILQVSVKVEGVKFTLPAKVKVADEVNFEIIRNRVKAYGEAQAR